MHDLLLVFVLVHTCMFVLWFSALLLSNNNVPFVVVVIHNYGRCNCVTVIVYVVYFDARDLGSRNDTTACVVRSGVTTGGCHGERIRLQDAR